MSKRLETNGQTDGQTDKINRFTVPAIAVTNYENKLTFALNCRLCFEAVGLVAGRASSL